LRRRSGFAGWLLIVPAAIVVFLTWQYITYLRAGRTLPDGLTVAGIPMGGKTRAQALNELEVAFATPLELRYVDQPVSLFPDTVELRFDLAATAERLDEAVAALRGLDGFIAHVLRRPPASVDVPAIVSYSPERVVTFLERVAAEYDRPPQEPQPTTDGLDFIPGQPGYRLDLEASRYRVAAALTSAVREPVALVVTAQGGAARQGTALAEVIGRLLDAHPGLVGGVFVKDLASGTEVALNADVAFSGMSVLKIALLEETYRALDPPLSPEVAAWLSGALGPSDGHDEANRLLAEVLGGGDQFEGAENLSARLHELGLVNTFLAAPFGDFRSAVAVVTPANSRAERRVRADPRGQTTPLEMGLLLEMIVQCSAGGGTLLAIHPEAFDPAQCGEMLNVLSATPTDAFIEAGVPPDVRVAHKQALSSDTHADAGVVFGRGSDFVLVVFLYRPEWLPYEESAPLIADIAAATYNYFTAAP